MLDEKILLKLSENLVIELNKIIDPQLGSFLPRLNSFQQQLQSADKEKTISLCTRARLVDNFVKLSNEAQAAQVEIDQRLTKIDKEITAKKLVSTADAITAPHQAHIQALVNAQNELLGAKKMLGDFFSPVKAGLVKQTLQQGTKVQLQQVGKDLAKIENKLISLIKKLSPLRDKNTLLERFKAFFMEKGADKKYLGSQRNYREQVFKQVDQWSQAVTDVQNDIAKKVHHANQLTTSGSTLQSHENLKVETAKLQSSLCKMFGLLRRNKPLNQELEEIAKDLTALTRPILSK